MASLTTSRSSVSARGKGRQMTELSQGLKIDARFCPAEVADPFMIICSVDVETAAKRHLQRGLDNPEREFYHEDKRVSIYRATGEMGTPKPCEAPDLQLPTVYVTTESEYSPTFDELVEMIRRQRAESGT